MLKALAMNTGELDTEGRHTMEATADRRRITLKGVTKITTARGHGRAHCKLVQVMFLTAAVQDGCQARSGTRLDVITIAVIES